MHSFIGNGNKEGSDSSYIATVESIKIDHGIDLEKRMGMRKIRLSWSSQDTVAILLIGNIKAIADFVRKLLSYLEILIVMCVRKAHTRHFPFSYNTDTVSTRT